MTENRKIPIHIEADGIAGGLLIYITGVRCIDFFSSELTVLRLSGGTVRISGSGLAIRLYEGKCVEISGEVREVGFLYGKS